MNASSTKCEECGANFKSERDLIQHSKIHESANPNHEGSNGSCECNCH